MRIYITIRVHSTVSRAIYDLRNHVREVGEEESLMSWSGIRGSLFSCHPLVPSPNCEDSLSLGPLISRLVSCASLSSRVGTIAQAAAMVFVANRNLHLAVSSGFSLCRLPSARLSRLTAAPRSLRMPPWPACSTRRVHRRARRRIHAPDTTARRAAAVGSR